MSEGLHDQWHLAVSRELEARVKGRMFFVRVAVATEQTAPGASTPADVGDDVWDSLAERVEQWLEGLDPDAVDEDNLPEYEVRPGDTLLELAAIPKKPNRRGTNPLIVNPYPGIAVFTGSYSTGPPPQFDDGTQA